jgi:hypothetical protein
MGDSEKKKGLEPSADRAFRFLAGLNLQDHPIDEQRESLAVVGELKEALVTLRKAYAEKPAEKIVSKKNSPGALPPVQGLSWDQVQQLVHPNDVKLSQSEMLEAAKMFDELILRRNDLRGWHVRVHDGRLEIFVSKF